MKNKEDDSHKRAKKTAKEMLPSEDGKLVFNESIFEPTKYSKDVIISSRFTNEENNNSMEELHGDWLNSLLLEAGATYQVVGDEEGYIVIGEIKVITPEEC